MSVRALLRTICTAAGLACAFVTALPSEPCLRWKRTVDAAHPERPARYVNDATACRAAAPTSANRPASANRPEDAGRNLYPDHLDRPVVVHAGDKLVLLYTEHSAATRLLATALEDAVAGDKVRVRSSLGSAVLVGCVAPDGSIVLLPRQASDTKPRIETEKRCSDR